MKFQGPLSKSIIRRHKRSKINIVQFYHSRSTQMRGIIDSHPESGMLPSRYLESSCLNESEAYASLSLEMDPTSSTIAYTVAAADDIRLSSADAEWDQQKEQIIQL